MVAKKQKDNQEQNSTTDEEIKSVNVEQNALFIQTQYIKDFSLEIPLAPAIFKEVNQAPNVHIDFSMNHQHLEDNNYNINLTAKLNADVGDKKFFIVELTYSAVATVNVAPEHLEPVIYIEIPRLLFPFVRSIIANSLSEAGLPPMMLAPIDFVALYAAKKAKEKELQEAAAKK